MPQTPHVEKHFTAGATVRDVVIGMSDGLTVPFALAAGGAGGSGKGVEAGLKGAGRPIRDSSQNQARHTCSSVR